MIGSLKTRWLRNEVFFSRAFKYAAAFCAGLFVFELIFLPLKFETLILANHVDNGNFLRLLTVVFLSAASLGLTFIFFFVAFASSFGWRIFYLLIFALVTFAEYSHYKAFGRFSTFHDAAVAFFVGDWKFVVNAAWMYFNPLGVLPVAVFCFFSVHSRQILKRGFRAFAVVLLASGGFFFATAYFTRNLFYPVSFSASARTLVSFPVVWYLGTIDGYPRNVHYANPRPGLSFQSKTTPRNNIVMIVDESVRGDYLSINGYERSTTAFLDDLNQKNLIRNWGIAAAGSTCSSASNNLLLTGLIELPDHDFKLLRMPTVFQYAKAMNYKTFYIDAQVSNVWNGKESDKADFGERITVEELSSHVDNNYDIDGEVARRIKTITAASTGNFVWVNKNGVHKPYTACYPDSGESSASDGYGTIYNPGVDQDALKSQYEKAIRYNSELFFSELFKDGAAKNTFYIYTSDHGQTLLENGETASHCSTSRPEAAVPLLIISGDPSLPAVDTTYKASHSNIFPSILDLLNVPESERRYSYALSLFKATASDSSPRFYMSGDLHGVGSARKYPFD